MGHEVGLQIFPEDHDVVRDWLSGRHDGNSIQHCFHVFGYMRRGMQPGPFIERDAPEVRAEAQRFIQLAQQYPWLLCGFCDLDRRYDLLLYLLELMAADDQAMEMARAAVLGTRQVAGSARSGQGFSINWSTPDETVALERYLKNIDTHEMCRRFSVVSTPSQRTIYKSRQDLHLVSSEERHQVAVSLSSDLQQLVKFYSAARQTGFGVIVLRD